MDIKMSSPTDSYNLKQGQIIVAGSSILMVISININDYRIGFIDLSTGETVLLKENGDNTADINGLIIFKVFENVQAKLILP